MIKNVKVIVRMSYQPSPASRQRGTVVRRKTYLCIFGAFFGTSLFCKLQVVEAHFTVTVGPYERQCDLVFTGHVELQHQAREFQ